ncbi:MAG: hypothetical protein HUJ68_09460 [Clostridia bacterium]|nr:hypothetical protein [Clostridia bacterium]
MGSIKKINVLLKQIEPKLDFILRETEYPAIADKNKIFVECRTICVLMNEIMDIVGTSGQMVFLAPYFLKGKKLTLPEISQIVAQIVDKGERICNN